MLPTLKKAKQNKQQQENSLTFITVEEEFTSEDVSEITQKTV